MANIEFDPIVNRMSKRVGNFVYSSWKGRNVIRKYTEKRNTESTPAQQKIRNAFKTVTAAWKIMPRVIRKSWKNIADAKAITEFNAFVSANASNQANGKAFVLSQKCGLENLQQYSASSTEAGSADISFSAATDGRMLTVGVQKITDGTGEENIAMKYDNAADAGRVRIDGLESGSAYYLYCIATDKVIADAEKVSDSYALIITVI